MKHIPLFESQHLQFTPIDLEKDPKNTAAWTYELDIAARLREDQPARPMATFEIKKVYDRWQKEADEKQNQYIYAIRQRDLNGSEENPILGVLRIKDIEWVHGAAYLDLIIADDNQWCQFAREALDLALRYAFDEMNLFRVTAVIAEHNQAASDLYEQANFTLEVRQRQSVYWNGRAWDKLYFGLLRPEWKMQQLVEVGA
jgi:RimJ/RimL family protein N-acetyltransferase